jgi:hypothetical protein
MICALILASLVTVNVNIPEDMHQRINGALWQASNSLAAYQVVANDWHATTTNINQRVVESNQRAAETHVFWQQVQKSSLWILAFLVFVFREHAQKLIIGAGRLALLPITKTKAKGAK